MNTNEQKKMKYRYRNDESTKRKCNVTNRLMCVNKCRSSTDRPNRIEATKSWWKMTKRKLYAGTVLASREYTLYIYRRHRSNGMSFWYKNGLPTFVYCEQRTKKTTQTIVSSVNYYNMFLWVLVLFSFCYSLESG